MGLDILQFIFDLLKKVIVDMTGVASFMISRYSPVWDPGRQE
jgi:hypothetical protein